MAAQVFEDRFDSDLGTIEATLVGLNNDLVLFYGSQQTLRSFSQVFN